jgi:hypothetical protein
MRHTGTMLAVTVAKVYRGRTAVMGIRDRPEGITRQLKAIAALKGVGVNDLVVSVLREYAQKNAVRMAPEKG